MNFERFEIIRFINILVLLFGWVIGLCFVLSRLYYFYFIIQSNTNDEKVVYIPKLIQLINKNKLLSYSRFGVFF